MNWFIAILSLGLQDPAALSTSAKEKSKKGDYKGAEADLSRALEAEPRNVDLLLQLGDAHCSLGEWERSVQDYSRAIEFDPGRWLAHASRGIARINTRDLDGAILDLTKAAELAPEEPI